MVRSQSPGARLRRSSALGLLFLSASTGMVGCSKNSGPATESRHPTPPYSGEHVPGVPDSAYQPPAPPAKAAENRNLPRADLSTPDSQYVPVTSGAQLMFLYQALSGLPPDLDKTASEYSKEYAGTADAFRRHDLLEALKPKFEALRSDAKSHPYIRWDQDYTHVDHYDFARKGFLIKDPMLQEGGYGYMADIRGYNISFTNGEAVSFVPVADENRARELEALLQKNNFPIRFYAFAQSADDRGDRLVRARLVKVQVLDRSGQVVLESKATD
jgi:hypothetical protein